MKLILLGPTSDAPDGASLGLGCQRCPHLELCGGFFAGFDCLVTCCNDPARCNVACPKRPDFAELIRDAGGFDISRRFTIYQGPDDLPTYIPHVGHGYDRTEPLNVPWAALTTFKVASRYGKRFESAAELRRHFGVALTARILLLSIGRDARLERFWQYCDSEEFPEYLAALGISHVTAPNFSFPLAVPRHDHILNRMRTLRSAERLAAAGLSVIPHVNAFNERDYALWLAFLREHPQISIIAQEFQTGLAIPRKARWHIAQLSDMEQLLGRPFRLMAVGGRRHLPFLTNVSKITIVDSVPFVRTQKRRRIDRPNGKWLIFETPSGAPIHNLLRHNVSMYARGVEAMDSSLRRHVPLAPNLAPEPAIMNVRILESADPAQLSFWSERRSAQGATK